MALLTPGSLIDQRTIATLTAEASVSFAHGLPAAPDFVIVHGSATQASATLVPFINWIVDATNVTIQNSGSATSGVLQVTSIVAHSVVR